MGSAESNESTENGFRILSVSEFSPASNLDLIPYIEFLVDVKNKPEKFQLHKDFYKFMIQNEGNEVGFIIYNILTNQKRVVRLVLNREWPNADSLLGFKVRYESFKIAQQNLFRVTRVLNPDLKEKVKEGTYFLIAVNEFIFDDLSDFREKILVYRKCQLVFFDSEVMRIQFVEMDFNKKKGLGLELGLGYLHDLAFIYNKYIKEKEMEDSLSFKTEVELQSLSGNRVKQETSKDKFQGHSSIN